MSCSVLRPGRVFVLLTDVYVDRLGGGLATELADQG